VLRSFFVTAAIGGAVLFALKEHTAAETARLALQVQQVKHDQELRDASLSIAKAQYMVQEASLIVQELASRLRTQKPLGACYQTGGSK
jgi:hypothetical protein